MRLFLLAAGLAAALIVTGCATLDAIGEVAGIIQGSGNRVTETREASGFDRIVLATAADLELTQGGTEQVEVTADDNLVEYFTAEVEGGTLTLRYDGPATGFNSSVGVVFSVVASDLEQISAASSGDINVGPIEADRITVESSSSGGVVVERLLADDVTLRAASSGDVVVRELEAESLSVEGSSSGSVRASGRAGEQEVTLSSSGGYEGSDLESATARVRVSSSGTATVWAVDELDASTTSSGSVEYYGSPDLTQSATSSGDVRSLGSR